MQIEVLGSPIADYAVDMDAKTITVAGVVVYCEAEEQDSEHIVSISMSDEGPVLGRDGAGGFIADIIIPPRRYENVEYIDEKEEVQTKAVALPLDMERITLRLWPNFREVA